jgi:hypothetical protein
VRSDGSGSEPDSGNLVGGFPEGPEPNLDRKTTFEETDSGAGLDAAGVEELDHGHALLKISARGIHVEADLHPAACADPQVRRVAAALRSWVVRVAVALAACAAWALGPSLQNIP